MDIRVVAVQHLATGEASITRVLRRKRGIRTTDTEQCLRETMREQGLSYMLWPCEEVGMTHLLRGERAPQHIYRVFMPNDIPAFLLLSLSGLHMHMVAEIAHDSKL